MCPARIPREEGGEEGGGGGQLELLWQQCRQEQDVCCVQEDLRRYLLLLLHNQHTTGNPLHLPHSPRTEVSCQSLQLLPDEDSNEKKKMESRIFDS